MIFPKFLIILLETLFVKNTTKSGEVTDAKHCHYLELIDFLSHELGFHYKVYSAEFRQEGGLYAGDFFLQEIFSAVSAYPHKIEDATFAVLKPGYKSNSLGFLRPFTIPVWFACLLCVVLMTLATLLTFRGRDPFSTVLFHASVTLLGQHRDWKPRSRAQKLVVLSWSVGITFLTLAYAAVILSFLTVPGREKGITNFDELHDAVKKGKVTVLKLEGDGVDTIFIQSGSEKLKFLGKHIQKQKSVLLDNKGTFLKVIKQNVAVLGPHSVLEFLYGGDEHFISPDTCYFTIYAMLDFTKKRFWRYDVVSVAIHRVWGSGLYKKIVGDTFFRKRLYVRSKFQKMFSSEENTIRPLTLSDMSGALYLLLTGHILGLICLICEIVTHRYYH